MRLRPPSANDGTLLFVDFIPISYVHVLYLCLSLIHIQVDVAVKVALQLSRMINQKEDFEMTRS